jgi:amidase
MALSNYKEISAIAQKRRDSSIAAYYSVPEPDESNLPNNLTLYSLKCGYYTTEELEIIQCEAEHILEKIRNRVWTSVEVTKAFCKASALAQKLVSTARGVIGDSNTLLDQLCHRSVVS